MFETAELGQEVPREEYDRRAPALREKLLIAQDRLQDADFPVIVVFGGVDGAGKGETINLLNEWLDPRWLRNRAFDEPTQEETERPEYWRFWRALPERGRIGIMSSSWYSRPLLERVTNGGGEEHLEARLDEIVAFERTLSVDGALIIKFWLHLGKQAQEKRFNQLAADPLQSWRVTEKDWENWRLYDEFVAASERIISRTSTGMAPWHVVEGFDPCYRGLRVGGLLLQALEKYLEGWEARQLFARAESEQAAEVGESAAKSGSEDGSKKSQKNGGASEGKKSQKNGEGTETPPKKKSRRTKGPLTILSRLDLTKKLAKNEYWEQLELQQGRLNRLQRIARERHISSVIAFEGWDAGGKGGAIRRITAALDSRWVGVYPIGAPTDEESAHHYLWRFWRHLPRAGYITIFDRSWYGRVLVERVEGFAKEDEWRRAYAEINSFEEQLSRHGSVLLKFFIHIDASEQRKRFDQRVKIPYKRHKLTDEDLRNRERWSDYEQAVHDMVEHTSTQAAPWVLVEGNDKRFARLKILDTLCNRLEKRLA
jgi:polyphosphate kinase 2 (PPK2 family)